MNKKIIVFIISTVVLIGGIIGYNYYQKIFGEAITKDSTIYIGSNYHLMDVKKMLHEYTKNSKNFFFIAEKKKFTKPKAGKYILKKGMSMNDVVNLLRSGNQTPIKVSFNNQNTLEKFAGRISHQIEADSTSLIKAFTDSTFFSKK